jgi:hypothetical protein
MIGGNKMVNANDISYSYNTKGYMFYYKGKPIGGAGIDKNAKGCQSNLKLFKEQAELDKRAILNGYAKRYLDAIADIDKEETKTVWIIERGNLYSSDPWEIEGVFATEEAAKEYIKHSDVPELLHPSEWSIRR